MIGGKWAQIFQGVLLGSWLSRSGKKKFCNFTAHSNSEDLAFIKDLIETGKVTPVIERRYPLAEAAEAFQYLGEGHAGGKVVITIE